MEEKCGKAKLVWVTDRGIVSEENLESLRARGAYYLVGTPKGQFRRQPARNASAYLGNAHPATTANFGLSR